MKDFTLSEGFTNWIYVLANRLWKIKEDDKRRKGKDEKLGLLCSCLHTRRERERERRLYLLIERERSKERQMVASSCRKREKNKL